MKFVEKQLENSITLTGIVNLHFFEFPKDYYTESDSHPFYELVYVSSGTLLIESDGYNGVLEKNQIIVHYPNENHSLSCDEESSPQVIIIGFSCDSDTLKNFSFSPTTLSDGEIKNLAEVVKEGRNVFSPPFDEPTYDMKKRKDSIFGAEQILKIMFEYFLIKLVRRNKNIEQTVKTEKKEKFAIDELLKYLNENFTEKVTIDELAFLFNTNRSTVCKEFKTATGKTINEYINEKKIEKAEKLLKDTSKTITKISEELGFESIHYFTRFFTKIKGISPKKFR